MNKVVKVAVGQIGYKESPAGSNRTKYGKWFGLNGQPWCAIFLDWCFEKAGMGKLFPHNANAAYAQDQVVSKCGGKWMMKKNTSRQTRKDYLKKAKPGDIVTFDFGAFDAYRRHIGIVKEVKGNYLICIEGNTSKAGSQSNGGMVCEKDRSYTSVCAAVRPAWSTKSADSEKEQQVEDQTKPAALYVPEKGDQCYDLSAWQGELSVDYFKNIKQKGVKCVILRSSYTSGSSAFTLNKDKYFDHNIKNAAKASMHIGVYHFSQAKTAAEAKAEAKFCLECIEPHAAHIDLPVAFDWESYKRLTAAYMKKNGKTKNTEIVNAFCSKVKAAGYEPMIYASLVVFNNYLSANIHNTLKIWVAQYYKECQYKHNYYLWQYTSSNGKLDKNKFGSQGTKKKTDSILPDRGYFRIGDNGSNVKKAQQMLNKALAGAHWSIPENGAYDEATAEYVKLLEDVRHITIDGEFGEQCLKQCEKTVTLQMKACNRAVSICRDNAYVYGVGERAHRYGDPFSGTNVGPIKKIKEKKGEPHYVDKNGKKWTSGKKYTYANTMCCNVFATVAYGYGAAIKAVKDALKKGSGFGTSPDTITRYGFEDLGKLKQHKFDDIKKGDVICISSKGKLNTAHAFICTGGDWFAEAGSSGWGPDTIAHKKGLKKRFEKYQVDDTAHLLRYPKK